MSVAYSSTAWTCDFPRFCQPVSKDYQRDNGLATPTAAAENFLTLWENTS